MAEQKGFSFPPNAVSGAGFNRVEPLLTVDQLKERYLFGIDLTDSNGNSISNATIQHAINSAISFVEHKLDIIIQRTKFEERYDYRQIDYTDFNFIQLKKRPLAELVELKAQFPNRTDLVKYPEEWYVLEKESAQIQLSPVEGTFSGLIITNGGSYVPLLYGTKSYWAHLFKVTYYAGFCADEIPVIINETIGLQACMRIFDILGDIVLGGVGGIASESVGLDGANVSKNTTASAMYSGYSARIESYTKQLKENYKILRQYYNGIGFAVV